MKSLEPFRRGTYITDCCGRTLDLTYYGNPLPPMPLQLVLDRCPACRKRKNVTLTRVATVDQRLGGDADG